MVFICPDLNQQEEKNQKKSGNICHLFEMRFVLVAEEHINVRHL